ncbi:Uncharacterised protein [Mycobacteroides abscessus subsp. abscessus]|nr:Uncharacterised protein [Mycobacteroides abscessus subsp. abscessus]
MNFFSSGFIRNNEIIIREGGNRRCFCLCRANLGVIKLTLQTGVLSVKATKFNYDFIQEIVNLFRIVAFLEFGCLEPFVNDFFWCKGH